MERSSIQDIALNHISNTKKVYKITPERMFSEYNGEVENVKNYNNRQLLEMLQNADDAASEAMGEKKVLIKLQGDILIIGNTGHPFTEEGLRSIFYSYLSPKESKENQIGKKGLGFRSILSWSSKVTIKSHELCVAFSKDYSQRVLDELLEDEDFRLKFNQLNKGHTTPITILGCPNVEDVKVIEFDGIETYDTIVQLDLIKTVKEDVIKQIKTDLDAEVLLFLNNLQTIEIDNDGEKSAFSKKYISDDRIKIECFVGNEEYVKIWNINTLSGRFKDIDKPYNLSVAWQDDLKENKDVVYAYLRTRVEIKCKGVLHGSFELNSDRNLIVDDGEGYNRRLALLLPELIAQTAEKIAEKEIAEVNYKPISFLQIDFKSLNQLLNIKDLNEELKSKVKSKRVLPTIDNRFIPWIENDLPVYFKEEDFAQNLSPSKFPDLLLYCENKEVEDYVTSLGITTYKTELIIDDIASRKDSLPIDVYAKLIAVIHKYIDEDTDLNNRELFYDNAKNGLSFNKPIFLPGESSKYNLPKDLGVQIVSSDLATELLNKEVNERFAGLAARLIHYKIREYKFSELVAMIIEFYYSFNPSKEDIIQQNSHLFNLFSREENPGNRWLGKSPLFISKANTLIPSQKLYFGKDYDNPLIEDLFHFDKGKILASQKKHKAEDIAENDWLRFTTWLGVSYTIRQVTLYEHEVPRDFIDYCFRNYNYRNSIENYQFKNYHDLVSHRPYFGDIRIRSFDSLSEIISNNSFENIIKLLNTDQQLLSSIIEDRQPDGCRIGLTINYDRTYRTATSSNLKSFARWVFLTTKWIDTESGVKQSPNLCTTSSTVTSEFSPLIEKPKIDFDYFKRNGIDRDRLEYFLSIVGVHKSINTFSTNVLYSIFLSLPALDEKGEKAKTIYNQLAVNYEDKLLDRLDKLDPNYIDYFKTGKVLCKSGQYEPIQEVFYVNDKHYGETVIRQFKTIEIERRRGKEKIKKIFGVNPLDRVELSLEGLPQLHSLNNLFKAEMESFKPYVYVLRKEVDSGKEKNAVKETKFELVTQIKLKLTKEGASQLIYLDDYEHFYLKSRNCVYLKVPVEHVEIQDLKDDIHICSSIAEAFSAILDVDAQRQQIRELFSKNGSARDELLRSELDDQNLQKLNEARRILGITNNLKLEFWKSFVKCLPKKKTVLKEVDDTKLLEQLLRVYPQYQEIIVKVFDEINYEDINEETSSELIIELFKNVGIKIKRFNEFHYPPFDIRILYDIDFKRCLDLNKAKFKSYYFDMCLINSALKDTILDVLGDYDFLSPLYVNEVDYDVEQDLINIIKEKYDLDLSIKASINDTDLIYQGNLKLVEIRAMEFLSDKNLFDSFISENPRVQSLLYFEDQIDTILENLISWLGKGQIENGKSAIVTKAKRLSFGSKVILYDNLVDLKDQVDIILSQEELGDIEINNVRTASLENGRSKSDRKGGPEIYRRKPKVPKEEIGFLGEYLTYLNLIKTIDDKESIKWVSGYSQQCGINPDGKDGLGYDFVYKPNGAKYPRYVEVKVSGRDDAFHITSTEIRFGERYKKNYEIFLIRNIEDPKKVFIDRIQGIFDYKGKTFNNNDLFSVENDNYIIRYKRVEN